jgi:hypothetical protein
MSAYCSPERQEAVKCGILIGKGDVVTSPDSIQHCCSFAVALLYPAFLEECSIAASVFSRDTARRYLI